MIRSPARNNGPRGTQKALTDTLPAPVGGWNTRDSVADMSKTDAVVMENWIAQASEVSMRKGSAAQVTGFALPPSTLLPWNGPSSKKLFASTSAGIYEVTTAGVVGAAAAACTNQYWEWANFATPGGSYLIIANGVDNVREYDGTTWVTITGASAPAITGISTALLNSVAVMVQRLWFVEKNSMRAWYLPVNSIGGAAVSFDLGAVFRKGGHLVAMHAWTLDGGNGQDDYSVFISSEGEVAVYKGIDPASATTWAKVGTYFIGKPLGKRCFCRYGGDLLILCQNGLFPLSKALISASISRQQTLSYKIDPTFINAALNYGDNPGWRCVVFPEGGFILVNVPLSSTYSEQYVMSTVTNSWCKFTGWSALDFELFDNKLWFCNATQVNRAWVGTSDIGLQIAAKCQQAFYTFRYPSREKHMKLVRPVLTAESSAAIFISLDTDYTNADFPSRVDITGPSSAIWGTSTWDSSAVWGGVSDTQLSWESVTAPPFYAAGLRLQCASALTTISWSATNFVYALGGVL